MQLELVLYVYFTGCVDLSYDPYRCFNQDGSTALMIAAERGHHECLPILLAHGAEVEKARAVSAEKLISDRDFCMVLAGIGCGCSIAVL